ncbi:hypothetical protein EMPG_10193 [Blastomyces silverae]|uniref:Uncharacterized protein n=1 Tax=Blastomyces silverae TaxID=2060906 RepID=A0A0H1B4M5_9EURO|nr:hypothetical protein EMPG_10193 [Blastomyces silverae]
MSSPEPPIQTQTPGPREVETASTLESDSLPTEKAQSELMEDSTPPLTWLHSTVTDWATEMDEEDQQK